MKLATTILTGMTPTETDRIMPFAIRTEKWMIYFEAYVASITGLTAPRDQIRRRGRRSSEYLPGLARPGSLQLTLQLVDSPKMYEIAAPKKPARRRRKTAKRKA